MDSQYVFPIYDQVSFYAPCSPLLTLPTTAEKALISCVIIRYFRRTELIITRHSFPNSKTLSHLGIDRGHYILIALITVTCIVAALAYLGLATEKSVYMENEGTVQVTRHNVIFKLGPLSFLVAEHYHRRDVHRDSGTGTQEIHSGKARS